MPLNAEVAQLVELQPSKLVVASSSLVFRSKPRIVSGLFYFPFLPICFSVSEVLAFSLGMKDWCLRPILPVPYLA